MVEELRQIMDEVEQLDPTLQHEIAVHMRDLL